MSLRADDLVGKLVQDTFYIHSYLSVDFRSVDEPSEPQLAFLHLQNKLAEKEEVLRVTTAEVGTLQAMLDIEMQSCTLSSGFERVLVHFCHSYTRLNEIDRDLASIIFVFCFICT